ncbi:hypothetical protein JX000_08135 [Staphylococcus sp. SB1-57]|uniref:hypothetical protein n=1 Tax=unclassified Staphylococcus TaxID=91994 RepID=UPI00197EDAF4|nr:hypothetical protein [Staphylococcus sp. SB1-57]QSF50963.1 hypothetical protein JX000_08135 [Staphylococcus sp. SB1-57]
MDNIRNGSEFVLKHMYKIYLDRLEEGESSSQSKYFGSCEELQQKYFIGHTYNQLHDCINELSFNNYLNVTYGSNVPCAIILENSSIAYFEKEYSKKAKSLIKDLNNLRQLLGF